MDKLYIIIPAYNEELNITGVVEDWYKIVSSINEQSRLVVFDDGSKDNTYKTLQKLAESKHQLIVIHGENKGHGPTILYGYNYALEQEADFVFQTDSDNQTNPSEFEDFWKNRNSFSAQIGYRKKRKDGISRILVTRILRVILRCIFSVNVVDANCPFRLMNREILKKYINEIPTDFNLPNIILATFFVFYKEKICFKEISFAARKKGKNSINIKKIIHIGFQAIRDFWKINNAIKK